MTSTMPWDTASPESTHSLLTLSPGLKGPRAVLRYLLPFTIRKTRSVGSAQLFGTCQAKLVAEGCHPEGTLAQMLLPSERPCQYAQAFYSFVCYFPDLGVGCVKLAGTVQDTEALTHLCPSNRKNRTGVNWQCGSVLSAPLLLSSCATLATLTLTVFISSPGVPPISRLKIKCSSNTWHSPHTVGSQEPAEKPSTDSAGAPASLSSSAAPFPLSPVGIPAATPGSRGAGQGPGRH